MHFRMADERRDLLLEGLWLIILLFLFFIFLLSFVAFTWNGWLVSWLISYRVLKF